MPIIKETAVTSEPIKTKFGPAAYELNVGANPLDRFQGSIPISVETVYHRRNVRFIVSQPHPFVPAALLVSKLAAPSDLARLYNRLKKANAKDQSTNQLVNDNLNVLKEALLGLGPILSSPPPWITLRRIVAVRPDSLPQAGSFASVACD